MPSTPVRVMIGMAAGADLLVADVALEHQLAVDALLPMPIEDYAKDFDAHALTELYRLLDHPNVNYTVLSELPAIAGDSAEAERERRDALYVRLASTLARKSNLLIALWNGEFTALPGGTADTVVNYLAAHSGAGPTTGVTFVDDDDGGTLWDRQMVYWISVPRTTDDPIEHLSRPCFLSGAGEGVLRRHDKMPERLRTQLVELDHYNEEFAALQSQLGALPPDTLMRDLPAGLPSSEHTVLRRIDAEYGKADALAVLCQFHSHRLFRWFSYMASAMGLLFLIYAKLVSSKVVLLAYLAILLLGLAVFHAMKSRHWFSKHLAYRVLAETMRTKFYLRLTAADGQVSATELIKLAGIDQFSGFGWISNVLKNVEPIGEHVETDDDQERRNLELVRSLWIDAQQSYFKSKVGRLERTHKRLERLKAALVYVLAILTILLAIFSGRLAELAVALGFNGKDLLLFTMGLLPVWLGIWELYQDKMATRELLWQYRNQLDHFSRASIEIGRAHDRDRRTAILADLGKDSLMESYLWTIHRYHREHEPPAAG